MRLPRSARVLAATAVVALTVIVGGCSTPDPAPSPTPTGFATEAEAFAAAEETYRAYVDALNRVDLSDPATFEDVYEWTTGDALAEARESLTQMHADRWSVSGNSVVDAVVGRSTEENSEVKLAVCLDVSAIDVTDADGVSMVSDSRGDVQTLLVSLGVSAGDPRQLLISSIAGREGEPTC